MHWYDSTTTERHTQHSQFRLMASTSLLEASAGVRDEAVSSDDVMMFEAGARGKLGENLDDKESSKKEVFVWAQTAAARFSSTTEA